MQYSTYIRTFVTSLFLFSTQAVAQETPVALGAEDSFASENAVLDTSILFAIGGREARQELRGAFGWPTFQEGLAEGVYFRFDPDGYARFAPSPRLDTDVFEVICRPRTLVCMGRKEALQLTLNNRGQVQIQLENVSDNDTFVLADGISELPLPKTILQPMDEKMEILLSSGGELISRRNNNEVHRISLTGFGAVVPYLRWVAARQDYTVLPRGWPVPNSTGGTLDQAGLTQTNQWASPMPQPDFSNQGAVNADLTASSVGTDVAEVRGELSVLRELLLSRQEAENNAAQTTTVADTAPAEAEPQTDAILWELMQLVTKLQTDLDTLQQPAAGPAPEMPSYLPADESTPHDVARHLEYLMTEIGLEPDVALMVVQQSQTDKEAAMEVAAADQNQVINDILLELRQNIPSSPQTTNIAEVGTREYRVLSDYFQSVLE